MTQRANSPQCHTRTAGATPTVTKPQDSSCAKYAEDHSNNVNKAKHTFAYDPEGNIINEFRSVAGGQDLFSTNVYSKNTSIDLNA